MEPREWASLEPGLSDRVIGVLKSNGVWRRDGASLRLVCRQWRFEVDRHLTSIQPRNNREIVADDLLSLSRFSRLTALNATPFVRAYEATGRPATKLVTRLPITRLKLSSERRLGVGLRALTAYTGLTALMLPSVPVSESDLRLLSRLPLQELSLRCPISRMQPFFVQCRSLTRLEAMVLPGDRALPEDVAWLLGIVALKLGLLPLPHDFSLPQLQNLSSVSSLKNLVIASFISSEMDYLDALPALTHLEAAVATTSILTTAAFHRVLERLTHLRLGTTSPLELDGILRSGTQLTSLHLNAFSFDASSIKASQLKRLSIRRCYLRRAQSFFADLPPLETLTYSSCLQDPFAQLRLGDADLSRVRRLKVKLQDVYGVSIIARLTQLEVLGLWTVYPLSLPALRQLGSLSRLIQLGVSPAFPESATSIFLTLPVVERLEVLYLGEAKGFNASSLNMLKERVPHMLVETEGTEFDAFMTPITLGLPDDD